MSARGTTHADALQKAAAMAKIHLTTDEASRLIGEIAEVLAVFSKIDGFKEYVEEPKTAGERKRREDQTEKCTIDPFSNSTLVKNKKFIGPRLVE